MKNILLATTALVATAGLASAEVLLSGSAEIGVFGGGDIETQFHTDIDVTFTMSGTTDSGLTFGANIDLDESDTDSTLPIAIDESGQGEIEVGGSPAFDNSLQGGESIFVSGSFGTITMGDTDGALDFALSDAVIGGSITDNNEHAGVISGRNGYDLNSGLDGLYDGQIARYDYAISSFAFAVSLEIDDSDDPESDADEAVIGIGATYDFDLFGNSHSVGLGYQVAAMKMDADDDDDDGVDVGDTEFDSDLDVIGVSGDFNFGPVQVIANYALIGQEIEGGDDNDTDFYAIAVGYTFDAVTVAVNYGQFDYEDGDTDSGYSLIANYDLGGGLEVQAGYTDQTVEFTDADGVNTETESDLFSLGLSMSF